MKKLIKNIVWSIALSLIMLSNVGITKASHMAGSDITWKCIGKDSFMVTMIIYRDCGGVPLGNAPTLNVKCSSTGQSITSKSVNKGSPVDITPTCKNSCTRCQSSNCAFPYGIEQYTMNYLIDLRNAGSCCKVTFSFSECCRNAPITTGAANQGFYIDAELDRCIKPCDNSPRFTNPPIAIICIGQDFIYNHGVIDEDVDSNGGLIDSISYEWTPPLQSVGTPTSWTGQYAYDHPIFYWGFKNANLPPPRGLHLDTTTGDIQFRPMKIEQTVMAIKVKEWRRINGVMTCIGTIRRDLQIIVISCPNNNAPVLSGPFYKEICATNTVSFSIQTNDYDTKDTLLISWNGAIPGGKWSDNNKKVKHPTGTMAWTPGEQHASNIPYVFTVTVSDDACPVKGSSTRAYQILVKPLPKAQITKVDSGCGDYHLFAKSVLGNSPTYQWVGNFNPGFAFTGPYMHYKFNGPGRYPYSLQMDASGCTRVYFDTIEVDTFITIQLTKDHDICYGDTTKLTAGYMYNSGNVWFKWSTGDTSQSIDYIGTKDTTISVEIGDTLGCVASGEVTVRTHKLPDVSLGNDKYICSYGNTVLSPILNFDRSIQQKLYWINEKDNSILLEDINSITIKDSGSYICKVIDTIGCIGIDKVKVFRNPELIAYAPGQTICKGDPADLEANETGSKSSSVNYYWYDAATSGLVGITRKIRVFPSVTTDYKLIVKERIGGTECKDSVIVRVRVNPLPDITWSTIPERCVNGSVLNLNDYVVTSPTSATREWSSPSGGLLPIWPGDKFNPLIAGVGKHKVVIKVTNTSTNCVSKDSNMVTINPLPTPNAGKDTQICSGNGLVSLFGSPSNPPGEWRSLDNIGVEGTPGSYRFNPQTPGIINGQTYKLVYRYTDLKSCVNEDTMNMTVYITPVVNAGSYGPLCIDWAPITLNGTPVGGTWTGTGIQSGNKFNPSVSGVGTHTIKYKYTNAICTIEDETKITVNPLPVLSVSTKLGATTFCNNDGYIELVGSPSGGTWTGPTGAINFGYFFNTSICKDIETSYDLTYHYKDANGCENTKVLTLKVRPAPEILIDKSAPSLCFPASYNGNLNYKNSDGVEWYKDVNYSTGNFIGSVNSVKVEYQPDVNDLNRLYFWLHAKTTHNDNICKAVYDSVRIEMSDLPVAGFSIDPEAGCTPHEAKFTDESTIRVGNITRWDWSFGDGNTSQEQNPTHKYLKQGSYTVKLMVRSNANCAGELTKTATSYIVPKAGFIPDPELALVSSPYIQFQNKTTNETPGIKWLWDFGDFPTNDISTDKNPMWRYTDTGSYLIWLYATNEWNCKDSISRKIIIMPDVLVFIPTAFSPDGQGPSENNTFKVHVDGFSEFHLQIYSRWGELLYESTDYSTHSWRGDYLDSKELCPLGAYVYILEIKGLDGIDYKYSGTVTLLR